MSPWISVHFLQTQSDERLLAAARDGHERAFEALVQRYRRPLLRYCRRLLLPQAMADDAVQQGLLQAWLALEHGTEVRDARAWLYRVVHNAAVDALRFSRYDHEQLSDSLQGATAPHSDLERRIAVRQALAGLAALPELQRNALMRTAVEGHSHEQVAAALGVSDGSVRGLVYRARATLRASATAITPTPVVAWLAHAGRSAVPLAERLGGAGAAGGGTDAGGALLKGGVAVLTAGALVAGTAAVHPQSARRTDHARSGTIANQQARVMTADQGMRSESEGPGGSAGPMISASSAHDRAHASGIGNPGRAAGGRTNALFGRGTGSVQLRRLAATVAPARKPRHGHPAFRGGSYAGKPQPTANVPSRGAASETPSGSGVGRSEGSSSSQRANNRPDPGGALTADGFGGQGDPAGANDWSDGGAGSVIGGSADTGRGSAESADSASGKAGGSNWGGGNAGSVHAGSDDAANGTIGSLGEQGSGGSGAPAPTGHASSAQASAAEASSGARGNVGAPPRGDG